VRVRNGNDLQGLRFRAVDNQVRIDGEKPDFGFGQIAPPVPSLRKIRKINKLAADDGFHPVGGFLALRFIIYLLSGDMLDFDITPFVLEVFRHQTPMTVMRLVFATE
jgi:hypothetical protein